jgi:hypothetical protein
VVYLCFSYLALCSILGNAVITSSLVTFLKEKMINRISLFKLKEIYLAMFVLFRSFYL